MVWDFSIALVVHDAIVDIRLLSLLLSESVPLQTLFGNDDILVILFFLE